MSAPQASKNNGTSTIFEAIFITCPKKLAPIPLNSLFIMLTC